MNPSLSSLRTQLIRTSQNIHTLQEAFLGREPLLPGSVYTLRRRCGKPNCRCTRGQLHRTEVLAYRGGSRPQTITPRASQLEALRQWTEAYRRFRRARAQLVKLQGQMLQLVDAIGAKRVEQGKRKFQTLTARLRQNKGKA